MDCESVSLLTGTVAVLGILLPLVGVWIGQGSQRPNLPAGFKSTGLALQFVRNRTELATLIGNLADPFRDELRARLSKDRLLLTVYTLFLVGLAFILCHLDHSSARWVACVAALLALAAGIADVIENRRITKALTFDTAQLNDEMASGIRQASLIKWVTYFLAFGLLGFLLTVSPDNIYRIVGGVLLLNAVIGLLGLRIYSLLAVAVPFTGVASFIIGVLLFIRPERLGAIC
jgi:hypothetical protein